MALGHDGTVFARLSWRSHTNFLELFSYVERGENVSLSILNLQDVSNTSGY